MKRDMDLVRLILLEIEKSEEEDVTNMTIDGYSSKEIIYNAKLMEQNNLIEICKSDIVGNYFIGSLTWEGNDFLDKIRDDSTWHKTKEEIKKKGLPLVVDTIKTISTAFISGAAEGVASAIIKNGGQL